MSELWTLENEIYAEGFSLICGVDEAGKGQPFLPDIRKKFLAGPLVVQKAGIIQHFYAVARL